MSNMVVCWDPGKSWNESTAAKNIFGSRSSSEQCDPPPHACGGVKLLHDFQALCDDAALADWWEDPEGDDEDQVEYNLAVIRTTTERVVPQPHYPDLIEFPLEFEPMSPTTDLPYEKTNAPFQTTLMSGAVPAGTTPQDLAENLGIALPSDKNLDSRVKYLDLKRLTARLENDQDLDDDEVSDQDQVNPDWYTNGDADIGEKAPVRRVLIIGCEVPGLLLARELGNKYDVTVVDDKEFFEYTPGILRAYEFPCKYDVITVEFRDIIEKLGCKFILGKVQSVDESMSSATVEVGVSRTVEVGFDYCFVSGRDSAVCEPSRGTAQHHQSPIEKLTYAVNASLSIAHAHGSEKQRPPPDPDPVYGGARNSDSLQTDEEYGKSVLAQIVFAGFESEKLSAHLGAEYVTFAEVKSIVGQAVSEVKLRECLARSKRGRTGSAPASTPEVSRDSEETAEDTVNTKLLRERSVLGLSEFSMFDSMPSSPGLSWGRASRVVSDSPDHVSGRREGARQSDSVASGPRETRARVSPEPETECSILEKARSKAHNDTLPREGGNCVWTWCNHRRLLRSNVPMKEESEHDQEANWSEDRVFLMDGRTVPQNLNNQWGYVMRDGEDEPSWSFMDDEGYSYYQIESINPQAAQDDVVLPLMEDHEHVIHQKQLTPAQEHDLQQIVVGRVCRYSAQDHRALEQIDAAPVSWDVDSRLSREGVVGDSWKKWLLQCSLRDMKYGQVGKHIAIRDIWGRRYAMITPPRISPRAIMQRSWSEVVAELPWIAEVTPVVTPSGIDIVVVTRNSLSAKEAVLIVVLFFASSTPILDDEPARARAIANLQWIPMPRMNRTPILQHTEYGFWMTESGLHVWSRLARLLVSSPEANLKEEDFVHVPQSLLQTSHGPVRPSTGSSYIFFDEDIQEEEQTTPAGSSPTRNGPAASEICDAPFSPAVIRRFFPQTHESSREAAKWPFLLDPNRCNLRGSDVPEIFLEDHKWFTEHRLECFQDAMSSVMSFLRQKEYTCGELYRTPPEAPPMLEMRSESRKITKSSSSDAYIPWDVARACVTSIDCSRVLVPGKHLRVRDPWVTTPQQEQCTSNVVDMANVQSAEIMTHHVPVAAIEAGVAVAQPFSFCEPPLASTTTAKFVQAVAQHQNTLTKTLNKFRVVELLDSQSAEAYTKTTAVNKCSKWRGDNFSWISRKPPRIGSMESSLGTETGLVRRDNDTSCEMAKSEIRKRKNDYKEEMLSGQNVVGGHVELPPDPPRSCGIGEERLIHGDIVENTMCIAAKSGQVPSVDWDVASYRLMRGFLQEQQSIPSAEVPVRGQQFHLTRVLDVNADLLRPKFRQSDHLRCRTGRPRLRGGGRKNYPGKGKQKPDPDSEDDIPHRDKYPDLIEVEPAGSSRWAVPSSPGAISLIDTDLPIEVEPAGSTPGVVSSSSDAPSLIDMDLPVSAGLFPPAGGNNSAPGTSQPVKISVPPVGSVPIVAPGLVGPKSAPPVPAQKPRAQRPAPKDKGFKHVVSTNSVSTVSRSAPAGAVTFPLYQPAPAGAASTSLFESAPAGAASSSLCQSVPAGAVSSLLYQPVGGADYEWESDPGDDVSLPEEFLSTFDDAGADERSVDYRKEHTTSSTYAGSTTEGECSEYPDLITFPTESAPAGAANTKLYESAPAGAANTKLSESVPAGAAGTKLSESAPAGAETPSGFQPVPAGVAQGSHVPALWMRQSFPAAERSVLNLGEAENQALLALDLRTCECEAQRCWDLEDGCDGFTVVGVYYCALAAAKSVQNCEGVGSGVTRQPVQDWIVPSSPASQRSSEWSEPDESSEDERSEEMSEEGTNEDSRSEEMSEEEPDPLRHRVGTEEDHDSDRMSEEQKRQSLSEEASRWTDPAGQSIMEREKSRWSRRK